MANDPTESSPTPPRPDVSERALELQKRMASVLREKLGDEPLEPEQVATAIAEFLSIEIREIAEFHGPLPPPKMMAEYENVLSGLADRIASRAENEQKFRHESVQHAQSSERIQIHYQGISVLLGQIFGFTIGMTSVGGGIYLLANDKSTYGLVSIIAGLGALVAVFVTGKLVESKRGESDDKHDE